MQSESLVTEGASSGQPAGSTPTGDAAAEASQSGVAQKLRNLIADMGELIKAGNSLTAEELARAKVKLRAGMVAAKASLEEISERARNTAKAADRYVREQPWQAMGISASVGLLIGLLVGRRRR